MNVYTVREQDIGRVNVFTTKKRAIQYLRWYGYRLEVKTDMIEIWGTDYNQASKGYFRAYLEFKPLLGANHNYKYECKQLRATVRYLYEKTRHLQHHVSVLEKLLTLYEKEG